jgi:hypothetical protein
MLSEAHVMLPQGTPFDQLGIDGVDVGDYELVSTVA